MCLPVKTVVIEGPSLYAWALNANERLMARKSMWH